MTSLKRCLTVVLMFVAVQLASATQFDQKWVYLSCNLRTPEGVDEAIGVLEKAAAAGCDYAVITDSSHLHVAELPPAYLDGIKKFKEKASSLEIAVIPMIFPSGYGGRYLDLDRNLAAGLPVRNASFIVSGKTALPDPSAVPPFVNLGFEDVADGVLTGWTVQDESGSAVSADASTAHEGKTSLKITSAPAPPREPGARPTFVGAPAPANAPTTAPAATAPPAAAPAPVAPAAPAPPQPAPGSFQRGGFRQAGVSQTVAVQPFQEYRLTFWLKTDSLGGRVRPSVSVTSADGRRRLFYRDLEIEPTQDWTEYGVIFNTLDSPEIRLTAGMSAVGGGAAWIDTISIVPAGLVNVLRRENAPVTVTSADGATVYEEDKDYARIADPALDPYDPLHASPAITTLDGSTIADGRKLLVSWYHPMLINADQVGISISDPATFATMDREMKAVCDVWGAPGYFMNVDEIRLAGWENGPSGPDKRPSELLADFTEKAVATVRKYAPDATIYAWSDMYTPFHNARPIGERGFYYLVNGGWDGSWEKLPSDVVIIMWSARDKESVVWFADRGHKQVVAGYYDGDMKRNIARWMNVTDGVPGVIGMMYTTWVDKYDDLPEFFRLVDTYQDWAAEIPPQQPRQRPSPPQ